MTYRFVPKRWLRAVQVLTLLLTAIVGLGVIALPDTAVQLSKLEETMSANWFGWSLFAAGGIGGLAELWMWWKRNEALTSLVAWCHIVCIGVMAGYLSAATWGVLMTNWRTFVSPVLILMVITWHLAFVQRRPRESLLANDYGKSPRLTGRTDL